MIEGWTYEVLAGEPYSRAVWPSHPIATLVHPSSDSNFGFIVAGVSAKAEWIMRSVPWSPSLRGLVTDLEAFSFLSVCNEAVLSGVRPAEDWANVLDNRAISKGPPATSLTIIGSGHQEGIDRLNAQLLDQALLEDQEIFGAFIMGVEQIEMNISLVSLHTEGKDQDFAYIARHT